MSFSKFAEKRLLGAVLGENLLGDFRLESFAWKGWLKDLKLGESTDNLARGDQVALSESVVPGSFAAAFC